MADVQMSERVVTARHVVSSRGSGASSDDSWFHSQKKRHAAARERKIRPSPLNIYDLALHTFLATFLGVFRREVSP